MLSTSRADDGRRGYRHFAVDRVDEKSGRCDAHVQHGGRRRPFSEFVAEQGGRHEGQRGRAGRENQIAVFRSRIAYQRG